MTAGGHTGPSPSGFLSGLPDGSALVPALLDTGHDSCCQLQPGLQAPDCHSTESYGKERLTLYRESRRQAGSCCVIQVLFRPRQVPHYRGSLQGPPTVDTSHRPLCFAAHSIRARVCGMCTRLPTARLQFFLPTPTIPSTLEEAFYSFSLQIPTKSKRQLKCHGGKKKNGWAGSAQLYSAPISLSPSLRIWHWEHSSCLPGTEQQRLGHGLSQMSLSSGGLG